MNKTYWAACLVLAFGMAGCGGDSSTSAATDPEPTPVTQDSATAALGADLVPPAVNAALESNLIPDAVSSAAGEFPAELKPPVIS